MSISQNRQATSSSHAVADSPFPQAQGIMGSVGDGQGEGGSSLMKDRSGYRLTSMSATLSGDDDGT